MTVEAINKKQHGGLKIKANPTLIQTKNQHFAPLVVQEFVAASQDYPIVFVKDSETGQFKAIALLGLKPGENEFYSHDGWKGNYVPEAFTLYPFLINQPEGQDNAILCFDSAAPLVNDSEGQALFDDQGVQTQWLTDTGERVVQYVEKTQMTQSFITLLIEADILAPQTLTLQLGKDKEYTLNGLYAIDEKKLIALDDDKFNALRKTGAMAPIYASIISMQRINNIVKLKLAN